MTRLGKYEYASFIPINGYKWRLLDLHRYEYVPGRIPYHSDVFIHVRSYPNSHCEDMTIQLKLLPHASTHWSNYASVAILRPFLEATRRGAANPGVRCAKRAPKGSPAASCKAGGKKNKSQYRMERLDNNDLTQSDYITLYPYITNKYQ